jgi:hypothetical protein
MRQSRIKPWKRLVVEELEPRLLAAVFPIATSSALVAPFANQPGNGTLVGGGFPSDVPTSEPVAVRAARDPAAFERFGRFGVSSGVVLDSTNAAAVFGSGSPDATSGVGQMTIADGANTLGMNATPTSGFSSHAGGTGGPMAPSTTSQKFDLIPGITTGQAETDLRAPIGNDGLSTEPDTLNLENLFAG